MKLNYPIGLISNKNAKKNRKNKIDLDRIVDILGGPKKCLLRETSTLHELSDTISEFAEKRIEVLISNGGDGTHQRLINTILTEKPGFSPYFVPLKGGTMNMLPKNMNLNKSPYLVAEMLRDVMDGKKEPTLAIKNILEIEPVDESFHKRYGFVFIAGCGYNVLKLYYSFAHGGKYNAIKSIIWSMISYTWGDKKARKIYSYTPSDFSIDNKEISFPYLITLASGIENLVLGFSPFAGKKKNDDGFFIMLDGQPMHKNYTPFKFFTLSDHEQWNDRRILAKVKQLRLNVENGFSIDGELIPLKHPTIVNLKRGPKVRFICG